MLLRLDSVKHYTTAAQMAQKWTRVDSSRCTWSVDVAGGRNGGNAIKRVTTSATNGVIGYIEQAPLMTREGVWTPTDSGACGFAVKIDDLSKLSTATGASAQYNFLTLYEGSGPVFHVQLNPNGTFSYYFYSNAAISTEYVGSSVQGMRSNEWAYVENKWTIHETAGRWETWLNEVKIFDWTGRTSGGEDAGHVYTGVWNSCAIGRFASTVGMEARICDYYLIDQETSLTDDWSDVSGDLFVGYIRPEAVGDSNDFTPTSGDNFEMVDELDPDDDTTVNASTAPNNRDNFVMEDVPAGVEILGYQSVVYAKKTSDGSSLLKPTLRTNSTDYDAEAQGIASPDRYTYILQPYDVNPDTDAKLTEAEANALLGGYVKE